jgi:DNA-binding NtrC family response regulator
MPKISGKDVYHQIKHIHPDVKILLSSGYSKDSTIKEFIKNEKVTYIGKPYDAKKFLQQVAELLNQQIVE